MNKDNFIRDAIDESLSDVRFDAQDMRSVMRAVRSREQEPERRPAPKARPRAHFAFAMAMMLILVVPIGWFALRVQGMRTSSITATSGTVDAITTAAQATLGPQATADPHADPIVTPEPASYSADESEAIRIARACFEAVCDTSVFTFEEYAVDTSYSEGDGDYREYTVEMTSIYGNGCAFTVLVALPAGEVLEHSTPALATVPTYLDPAAPEIAAWYAKNGPHLLAWPQEAQAEFSRRYEGAALRTALPGELTADEAAGLAAQHAREALDLTPDAPVYAYPMLYAEQENGSAARYVVSCFASPIGQEMPEVIATVSFGTNGAGITVTVH